MALRPPPPTQPSRQSSKRVAPPSLFVGPPTPEAPPTDRFQSPTTIASSPLNTASTAPQTEVRLGPSHLATQQSQTEGLPDRQRQPSTTAQSWRALQSTFEEVELNALSGASVFGAEHSRALEELRKAQVELARAWARGEGDGESVFGDGSRDVFGDGSGVGGDGDLDASKSEAGMATSGPKSAVLAGQKDEDAIRKRGGSVGSASGGDEETKRAGVNARGRTDLEEETENDILLARKRRMANDRYFERVNKGVVDVVARLEIVAQKMGGVEMESQEIWGEDSDSMDSETG